MPEENKEWTMPAWMEPYRHLIDNTGGNEIEWHMNQNPDSFSNTALYPRIISVQSQIALLRVLRKEVQTRYVPPDRRIRIVNASPTDVLPVYRIGDEVNAPASCASSVR